MGQNKHSSGDIAAFHIYAKIMLVTASIAQWLARSTANSVTTGSFPHRCGSEKWHLDFQNDPAQIEYHEIGKQKCRCDIDFITHGLPIGQDFAIFDQRGVLVSTEHSYYLTYIGCASDQLLMNREKGREYTLFALLLFCKYKNVHHFTTSSTRLDLCV